MTIHITTKKWGDKMVRTIKFTSGAMPEFEIICTDAPDDVIKANMQYINDCEEKGEEIENPYKIIEENGFGVKFIGCRDEFTAKELEDLIIDAEFDYYTCDKVDSDVEMSEPTEQEREESLYIVVVDNYYMRDTQVLCPEVKPIPSTETAEFGAVYDDDGNWVNFSPSAYLGYYKWPKGETEGLKSYVAKRYGFDTTILNVISVDGR